MIPAITRIAARTHNNVAVPVNAKSANMLFLLLVLHPSCSTRGAVPPDAPSKRFVFAHERYRG
jgi:hypothetical protein